MYTTPEFTYHACEHALEFRRQHGGLHGDGLPDLEVEAAVVAQEVEHALRATQVQVLDRAARQRLRAEVQLVVEGDPEARAERA